MLLCKLNSNIHSCSSERNFFILNQGKGNEDKRGQSVEPGIASKCWLYLNGYPVRCNRYTEVASIVSAINPSLNVNNDAMEVALLQQQLLWLLYDKGHLSIYPMAIGLYFSASFRNNNY